MQEEYKEMRKLGWDLYSREYAEEAKRIRQENPEIKDLIEISRKVMRELPNEIRDVAKSAYKDHFPGHDYMHGYKAAFFAAGIAYHYAREEGINRQEALGLAREAAIAGLLHDIARKKVEEHPKIGARRAEEMLNELEIEGKLGVKSERIVSAIELHEIKERLNINDIKKRIVVESVYDADKMTWGLDLTLHRAWKMAEEMKMPSETAFEKTPGQFEFISKIAKTFKTPLGKRIGPRMLELGVKAGKELVERRKAMK